MLQVCLKHEFDYTQCCLFFGNRGEREALAQSAIELTTKESWFHPKRLNE